MLLAGCDTCTEFPSLSTEESGSRIDSATVELVTRRPNSGAHFLALDTHTEISRTRLAGAENKSIERNGMNLGKRQSLVWCRMMEDVSSAVSFFPAKVE